MLELLIFAIAGTGVGILFGLVPGLHPNTVIIFAPFVASFMPLGAVVFLVCLGISNIIIDFVPSILLGAPDAGSELAALPGQRLLARGEGYSAIKLMIIGFVFSFFMFFAMLLFLQFAVPFAFEASRHIIFAVLIFISCLMVFTERRVMRGLLVFSLAGFIGVLSSGLPVNSSVVLFPLLAGFFGVSSIILQIRNKAEIKPQSETPVKIDSSAFKSSFVGCLGGILSGFLPGVGSSEIASMFSMKKDERSFLVVLGAIAAANFLMSLAAIWLIGKTRSGIAVGISNVYNLSSGDIYMIFFASLMSVGIAVLFAMKASKFFLGLMSKISYSSIGISVLASIFIMTFVLAGPYGILLLVACTSLGIYAILSGVKRGLMMAALIVPSIIFFSGL